MPVRMSDHSILSKLSLAMIWGTVQSLYSFYTCLSPYPKLPNADAGPAGDFE